MALKPLKVSQVNKYIGRILSTDPILGSILIKGEISNLKYHGSGHLYFSLNDESSTLRCFMPSTYVSKLRYELVNGMEITAEGHISVYEQGGSYSLNVRSIEVLGAGDLAAAFRALYEKLESEGLFAAENKKLIPEFPTTVCIITAETGAAVRDILKIIKSRNNVVNIIVYPCTVQGEYAAEEIASAVTDVNRKFNYVDTIIVGRGGGSAEDLWAFNEEIVARSIFESKIPVISAVGHETDFTIADYVADRRAETPTAAAVMAVPDSEELQHNLYDMHEKIRRSMLYRIDYRKSLLKHFDGQILSYTLGNRVETMKARCDMLKNGLINDIKSMIEMLQGATDRQAAVLEAASPESILAKGYAIVRTEDGKVITSVGAAVKEQYISLQMKDGSIDVSTLTNRISKNENN